MTGLIQQPALDGGKEAIIGASPINLLIALEEVLAQLDRLKLHLPAAHVQMALDTLAGKY